MSKPSVFYKLDDDRFEIMYYKGMYALRRRVKILWLLQAWVYIKHSSDIYELIQIYNNQHRKTK